MGLSNYTDLLSSPNFRDTLFNTLLWILIVPAVTVVLGLTVAVLADRLGPQSEKISKSIIFLPMAISMVGAGTIWRFVYEARPAGQPQIGAAERDRHRARVRAGGVAAARAPSSSTASC